MKKNNIRFKKIYSKVAVLLIIVLFFALCFKILSNGIKIDSISIAKIKIDGLYLKLDKKLILNIANIDLRGLSKEENNTKKEMPKPQDITKIIRYIITTTSFFEHLDISNISYGGDNSSIYFDGNSFKINVPYVLASFKLVDEGNDDILLNIDTLKIKQEDLYIKGRILYLNKGGIFAFDLDSYINNRQDNVISYQGETNFKYLNIVLDSTKLDSIDILASYIKMLDYNTYEWMFKKSSFSNVEIDRAYLCIKNLDSKDIGKTIIDNLYASGMLKDAKVKFDDALPPAEADEVVVLFDKGKLNFYAKNATYDNVRMDKTLIGLSDFLAPQPLLSLNFDTTNFLLDSRVLNILNHYGIKVPILQKDGSSDGSIKLDILLPSTSKNLAMKVSANGEFNVKKSNISIAGVDLFVKNSTITLDNDKIDVSNTDISMKDILESSLNLVFDTNTKTMTLDALPSKFVIKSDDDVYLNLSNKRLKADFDFNGGVTKARVDDLGLSAEIGDKISVNLDNINLLVPYMPFLTKFDIKYGNANATINNDNSIDINANINNLEYPIYNMDKTRLSSLSIKGRLANKKLTLEDSTDKLKADIDFNSNDVNLSISNKYINVDEILKSKIPIFSQTNSSSSDDTKEPLNLLINGENTTLGLFGYDIVLDEAMLKTTQNGFIGNGKNKNGIANIILDNGTINVEANNFNADFINALFKKDVVKGGSFGLIGIYRDSRFVGNISMYDTSVRNMTSLQNILSFIDTIPSLLVFKLPGFSTSGYEINEANIRIGVDSNYIALNDINIKGSSVDITGNGVVDLNSKDLNIRLELSTIKNLSSILNKIPIVGYILLGEDGKISTDLTIKGSMDNPQTELSLLEDTAKAPINILKRVFSPFQVLIDELKKENKKRRGVDK